MRALLPVTASFTAQLAPLHADAGSLISGFIADLFYDSLSPYIDGISNAASFRETFR